MYEEPSRVGNPPTSALSGPMGTFPFGNSGAWGEGRDLDPWAPLDPVSRAQRARVTAASLPRCRIAGALRGPREARRRHRSRARSPAPRSVGALRGRARSWYIGGRERAPARVADPRLAARRLPFAARLAGDR